MPVPHIFATQSGNVPASQLDADFQYILDNTVQVNAPNVFTALQSMSGACFNEDKGANVVSASSIDLDAVTGNYVTISAANTITSVTLAEGAARMIRATGTFTWTNNASIVVQGGANYVAVVGDFFIVRGDAAGVVYVLVFPISGTSLVNIASGGTGQTTSVAAYDALAAQGSDISAGGTVNLATATGPYVNVTGSGGPITSLGTATAGVQRIVKFTSTPTLTHNGTSLILPGAANITAAANDSACFISLGSGNWICAWYKRDSGLAVAGLGSQLASAVTITGGTISNTTLTAPRGSVQTLSGPGAINVTTTTTKWTTTGADAGSLADGVEGQLKTIVMVVDGGDGTLTPSNFGNGSTITFNDAGDAVVLQFLGSDWWLLSNVGCTIA